MHHLINDIADLQRVLNHPRREKLQPEEEIDKERWMLRLRMISEEFLELLEATMPKVHSDNKMELEEVEGSIGNMTEKWDKAYHIDYVETADALCDIMVLCVGMAVEFGIPMDRVWEEVHASNMAKVGPDGKLNVRADGKVLKPVGWKPPNVADALHRETKATWPQMDEGIQLKLPEGE